MIFYESDSLCTVLGFRKEEQLEFTLKSNINIYPNPNNGLFNIVNNSGNIISIYDIYGRIIEVRMVQNDFETIDLHHLNKGIYLLHTTNIDSEKRVFKIVIE